MADYQVFPKDTTQFNKPEHHDKQGYGILTGKHVFAADNFPGEGQKLYARILGSPYAHAKIVSVDTSKAAAYPGVEAVCTRTDIPGSVTGKPASPAATSTMWSDTITHYGQPVAAVAAQDEDTASQAIKLIDVKYDVLPVVVEMEDAKKTGAPLVGVYPDSNVKPGNPVLRGDLEKGFAAADTVREYKLGPERNWIIRHLETNTTFARWEGDHLYTWFGTQNLYGSRVALAAILGMPESNVHQHSYGSGGGFGRRGDRYILMSGVMAAVLAKKAAKPVLARFDWWEDSCNVGDFPGHTMEIKLGAKKDGTLTAVDCKVWAEANGDGVSYGTAKFQDFRNTFRIPNAKFQHFDVVTHKTPKASWRFHEGGGDLIELAVEMFAQDLGMPILDFRLKNMPKPDEPCQETKKPYSNYALEQVLQKVREAIGWDAKWHAPGTKTLPDGRKHGIAIQGTKDTHSNLSSRNGAAIFMTRDGKCCANVGLGRVGSSTNSAMCSLVAESLGLNYEDVTPVYGDSDIGSEGGSQGGSTRMMSLGAAFHMAALDAKAQLFELAAPMLKVTAAELDSKGGKIFVKADPTKSVTFKEVASKQVIIGKGYSWAKQLQRPLYNWPAGTACENMSCPAEATEVAVDTETGEVEVLSVVNGLDMGKVIHRQGALGQLMGAIDSGPPQALWWENVFDKATGVVLTPNQLDQPYPTTLDLRPDTWQGIIVESDDACAPYGAIGIGEPTGESWTIWNKAVYNAIGVWIPEYPVTPQRILKALGKG